MALDIVSLVIFFAAFGLGVHFFFAQHSSALYFKFIACAVGCYALAELFWFTFDLLNGTSLEGFAITEVAYFGCYLFLLTANKGQFDSLIDDKNPQYKKYRYLAFIVPVFFSTMMFASVLSGSRISTWPLTIISNACYIPMVIASYYNFKHLIWPNKDYGFIKALRPTNLCLLIAYYADMCCLLFTIKGMTLASDICSLLIAIAMLLAIIFARKGRQVWLT